MDLYIQVDKQADDMRRNYHLHVDLVQYYYFQKSEWNISEVSPVYKKYSYSRKFPLSWNFAEILLTNNKLCYSLPFSPYYCRASSGDTQIGGIHRSNLNGSGQHPFGVLGSS